MPGAGLSADPGYRDHRVDCGRGHDAVYAGYREKVIDTVPGPVILRCRNCHNQAGAA